MTLPGGLGTIAGPSVGALMVVTLSYSLASLGERVDFILGAVFVACVLASRRGLVGELLGRRRLAAWSGRWPCARQGAEVHGR
jgi:branched-chain amino acid transport system permease protein